MQETVQNLNSEALFDNLIKRVAEAFCVDIDTDGCSATINSDKALSILRAKDTLNALSVLSTRGEIDMRLVDYCINLEKEGKLADFMKMRDEVFFTTFSGRPIRPKTLGQSYYIDAMKRSELVICSGPAGSGKTFLGVAMAVKAFKNREVSKIILARPAVEAGEKLGFLPGDIEEKVNPYMRPIYDALEALMGRELFEKYYEKGLIEVTPLAFMRGRNLDDAYILLDEAQNTTVEQMKMFLTRLGMNSKALVCGDFTQIDLPKGTTSGLYDCMKVLNGIEGISIVSLNETDIVRNPLVQKIVNAYAKKESN